MKVWIDQDLCTGDGLCTEIVPDLFQMHDDGLAYVKEVGWSSIYGPASDEEPLYRMADGQATVPESLGDDTIEAAEACPGECIFVEVE
jgi:ferredoxin